MRPTNNSERFFIVRFQISCADLVVYFFAVEFRKSNYPYGLNNESVIDMIFSFNPEIRNLQALVPILPNPTKKGQGPKITGQDSRKKRTRSPQRGSRP